MMAKADDDKSWTYLREYGEHLPFVLLYGPPGTGKTTLAMVTGLKPGTPAYRVNCTEDTPAAELRGHYIPRGATWEWHDGPAMMAYRNGGRLVVDEITRAADDALSFMLAILDGLPITLPSGETVTMHENFSCWGTTNDSPQALSDALADRFTNRVECSTVNPEALALLPWQLAQAVTPGTGTGISYREAAEFYRLTSCMPRDIAARMVWEKRAPDILSGLKFAEVSLPAPPARGAIPAKPHVKPAATPAWPTAVPAAAPAAAGKCPCGCEDEGV
jgi:DNA polymerase III delta prime subunit